MRIRNGLLMALFLFAWLLPMPAATADPAFLTVKKLSENLLIAETPSGNSRVAVLKTEKGLVMIDTGFSPFYASEIMRLAEKVFRRDTWAYLIQTSFGIMNNGGSKAFSGIPIIAHRDAADAFVQQQAHLREYLNERSVEFKERAQRAEEQLKDMAGQSERAAIAKKWIAVCQRVAHDFQQEFEIISPTVEFSDRMTLHLGSLDVILYYFGSAAEAGDVICWIPQEGFVWLGDVFHSSHILPFGSYSTRTADIPRWIWVFDQILDDGNPIKHVYRSNGPDEWSAETFKGRRDFIQEIHQQVAMADANGRPLKEVMNQLSNLSVSFPYLSSWPNFNPSLAQADIRRTVAGFWKIRHASVADKIGGMIDSEGLKAARTFFDAQKKGEDSAWYFLESEFNALGYRFLGRNRLPEAIEVFRMNTELYPESANVYDSLGEAYLAAGDKEKAIANYEKSLQLNPQNQNAETQLQKLRGGRQ